MTILCGTDFSEPAGRAVRGSAALCARLGEDLVLVHVVEHDDAKKDARRRLDAEVARASAEGIRARAELLSGIPDEVLVARAGESGASLIVVGALGRRRAGVWTLGSTADRVAQTSTVPVIVLRDERPFEAWKRGERPLSIVAGVDATESSDAAVVFAGRMEAAGPCSLACAHVYWPPEAKERLGIEGGIPIGKGHPEVERALEAELRARIGALRAGSPFAMRFVGGLGRTADHLVRIAAEERADLIVVGTHQRAALPRFWHGSVSHGTIDLAATNVACAPS